MRSRSLPPIAELLLIGFCTGGIYETPIDEPSPAVPGRSAILELLNLVVPPVVILFLDPILARGTDICVL